MRPVDADAMLAELKPVTYEMEHSSVTIADMSNIIRNWVERQPTLTPQNEWVSVEERLPEDEARQYILNADCPRICVENPVSSRIYEMPPYSQEVQPWMFGHPVSKKTRLWLKGLPLLQPTDIVDPKCGCHEAGTWFMKGGKDRQKNRAKTFPGLAKAMAEQWGGICPPEGEENNHVEKRSI